MQFINLKENHTNFKSLNISCLIEISLLTKHRINNKIDK